MTAPALIALYPGSLDNIRDQRAASTVRELAHHITEARPDLTVDIASLDNGPTSLSTVASRLAFDGIREAVVVPLFLTPSTSMTAELDSALDSVSRLHLNLTLRVTEGLGLEGYLLSILDARVREALSQARVRELDALVLATDGVTDPLVLQSLQKMTRVWSNHHNLPVTLAFTENSSPAPGEAVRAFRRAGKRHVAVASFFISPDRNYYRATEQAKDAGAIAVSAPLGAHEQLSSAVLGRYLVGALDLVPLF